jgi:biopolymer transport protein ExbD
VLHIELPTIREVPSVTETQPRSVLAISAEGKATLDSLRVPDGLLDAYLKAYLKENPGRRLELEADRRLPLEKLLEVWDALTGAGIRIKDVPARIRLPAEGEDS